MINLLLSESSYNDMAADLAIHQQRITIVRLQADGSLKVNGDTVSAEQYPIHATWFSLDIIKNKQFGPFIKLVTSAPDLQWMQSVTAGLDAPFFKQIFDQGVRLSNSDAQAPAIAEYVVAAVLSHYQKFAERAQHQANAQWQDTHFQEIHGSRWLIVGLGNIGQRVGQIARGFEAHVTGVKRALTQNPHADQVITYSELAEHLPQADVVVLACALTEQTRHLFDARMLRLMKPTSVLVNIARGGVVDEPALIQVLDEGLIDHAVLDVFEVEPLPGDSPLWQHPRVMLTPHSSNRGDGTGHRGQLLFLANLTAFLDNKPLKNAVTDNSF
ncbi:D-2-hydroxyacid dehydrogenase [Pseudomonadales bacterium]|nr:D-2-hydroxyacid dehydrogenase [Pseudomonadales bacterium]MDB9866311.1 D-2-hydroxyacid dehydrogenase [Pseudomonadales bacterium]MDB9878972.1 D-2-hydroxyacid dehydrogenase [Pseudomonadales bacterium]MDB9916362.1 D-2-hydroxyacid dehydrogenase [Pseudomonadales bacterium]